MATITLTVGSNARQYTTIAAAWAAIPTDVVGSGNSYVIELYNDSEFIVTTQLLVSGKTTGPNNTITIQPAAGQGYASNPNFLTNALRYNQANGVAIKATINNGAFLNINTDYVTVRGLQVAQYGTNQVVSAAFSTGKAVPNTVVENNLVEYYNTDPRTDTTVYTGYALGCYTGTLRNNLIILKSATCSGIRVYINQYGTGMGVVENNTIVRIASLARAAGFGIMSDYPGSFNEKIIRNNLAINVPFCNLTNPSAVTITTCASDGVVPTNATKSLSNLVAADIFVDPETDFRIKSTAPVVDAGVTPEVSNLMAVTGNRQQGNACDIGMWEYPSAVVAPTATVTARNITGTTVTISGTTTGLPNAGTASAVPVDVPYNKAELKGPIGMTLGTGTFTLTFSALKVGKYKFVAKIANSAYEVSVVNPLGDFEIIGAVATQVIQDPMDGQYLTVHGTTTGTPTSGTLTVPADPTNPAGAVDVVVPLVLTPNAFTVTTLLPPGNYAAGTLILTSALGTSMPQGTLTPVLVLNLTSNAEVPMPTPSSVTGVTVTPGTATGPTTFSAVVAGTNAPQDVAWSTTAGQISSTGVFTPPAATDVVQTITIKATSIAAPTYSGTATVTIDKAPRVNTVTVTPATFTVAGGGTVQLTAAITGINNPDTTVTWSAPGATISSTGLFTAPAAIATAQTFTVKATSNLDNTKFGTAVITVSALPVATPTMRTLTLVLADTKGILANLANIKVAVFDEPTPDLRNAPKYRSSVQTTNALGEMKITFATTLSVGQLCGVSVQTSDGSNFDVFTTVA
jgi:hypothetical protein